MKVKKILAIARQFPDIALPQVAISGHSNVGKSSLIEHYLMAEPGPTLGLMLLDIRHGPKDLGLRLIEWLNAQGIRWQPIATKADKLSGNASAKILHEMSDALGGMLAPMSTSSLNKRGALMQVIIWLKYHSPAPENTSCPHPRRAAVCLCL